MKLAILGDSFCACMREALSNNPCLVGNHEVTFFAGPSQTMSAFSVEGNVLVARDRKLAEYIAVTSGISEARMDPSIYDFFITVGLGIDFRPIPANTYSAAVVEVTCRGLVETSLAFVLIQRLRRVSNAPILCIPAPLKALELKSFMRIYPNPLLSYANLIDQCNAYLLTHNSRIIEQPSDTRSAEWITRPELSRGSRRLIHGTIHPETDNVHMNADYGARMMNIVLSNVVSTSMDQTILSEDR